MLGMVLSLIPNSVASHLANNDIVKDVVFSAKVLVFARLPTEEMSVGADLTPLVEVGDLLILKRYSIMP